MALGLGHGPAAADSIPAPYSGSETANPIANSTDSHLQAEPSPPVTPSGAEIGIRAMMQMLRDEGIDIDARMQRARTDCRNRITSEAGDASAEAIERAIEECTVGEEGIIYARAINEMNANRVNTFNNAMAQYNAQVAEAERKQREYESSMQGHNAEVAELQRQQEQYEREMAEHQALYGGRGQPAPSRTSRQVALADNTPAAQSAPPPAQTLPPVQTQQAAPPPTRTQQTAPPPAARTQQPSNSGALAANTAPTQSPQAGPTHQYADNRPAVSRGGGMSPPTQGRRLTGNASQEEVELAIMEATGPRIALVIGNEKYGSSMGSLANPVNDAVLIGATLRSLGFDVEILTDASQREMKEAVQRLGDRLLAAGGNATGLFYYAGHGVQSGGSNFLIPVGAMVDSEGDLELEAVKADAVLAQLEESYVSTRIVILDACRNMPLRRRTRNGARGLARMETPNGSFVAYSTSPGSTAADGGGIHSPFAESLAAQMLVPDRPIEVTFREVRRQVVELTNGDQVPWDSSSLLDTFSFARTR